MQKRILSLLITLTLLLGIAACADTQPAVSTEPAPPADEPSATPQPDPTADPTIAPEMIGDGVLLVPDGEAHETYYAAYPLTMTLDGDPGDWTGVPRVVMPEDPAADTTMQFAAAADDTHIYMLADVKDSHIVSGKHGTEFWNEDSVEFYFNATQDLSLTKYKPGVTQITIPPANIGLAPEDAVFGGMTFNLEGMEAVVVETDNGYLVEATVPLESNVWSIDPSHGNVIGFQSHLNGTSAINRDLKLIWSAKDTADVSYQNPSVFGQLIFYEIGQADVAANVPPTATPPPTRVPVEEDAPYLQPDLPVAERVDEAVTQILTVKMEMGLFERPYSNPDLLARVGSDEHRTVAREAVAQSLVLLKNDGPAPLPLSPDLPAIYVAGTAADDIGIQSGGWTIEWQGSEGAITEGTTILEAVQAAVSPDTDVIYNSRANFADLPTGELIVCIAAVGEKPYAEGYGDSAEPALPVLDQRVLERMRESCDQLTVVLISGRPLIVTDQIDSWDAVVAAWLPGTEGQGVTDLLFGARPFSGKLPYTWPRSVKQLPFDFETLDPSEPLFPFGHGLTTE